MIALVILEQSTRAGLVAAGLAAYAPAGTQLPPEPPWTVSETSGAGAATSNASY
jgi:hypothetical protein